MSHLKKSMSMRGVHGVEVARLFLQVLGQHCCYQTAACYASEIGERVAVHLVRYEHESPFFIDPPIAEFLEGFASVLMGPAAREYPSMRSRS
jgi:hypothetical protein